MTLKILKKIKELTLISLREKRCHLPHPVFFQLCTSPHSVLGYWVKGWWGKVFRITSVSGNAIPQSV